MDTESENVAFSRRQVAVDFPNGLHVSIITDGYGSEKGLYEAFVTTPSGDGVPNLIETGPGDGIYGWLGSATLGILLQRAASAELRTVYVVE